jgi:hypothetical protein
VCYFGFPWSWIFLPQYILLVFMCRKSWWGHCPWIVFSQIYFTFFMIYASRLRFMNLFSMWSSVFVLLFFFFSQPDVVNITWITGRIHRSIVDKIDPTLWGCRKGKKNTLSITFGHIFLWNMIRRIYLPCFQLISKKYFWWTVTRTPLMMAIVIEICSLNLFVVLDLDLEPIWIEISFFFVSQNLESNIIYFICFEYEKGYAVYVCRFLWKYSIPRHVR